MSLIGKRLFCLAIVLRARRADPTKKEEICGTGYGIVKAFMNIYYELAGKPLAKRISTKLNRLK